MSDFAKGNFLQLNLEGCMTVVFSRAQRVMPLVCEVDGAVHVLPAGDEERKCLGYLFTTRAAEGCIVKARRTCLHYYYKEISSCSVLEIDVQM